MKKIKKVRAVSMVLAWGFVWASSCSPESVEDMDALYHTDPYIPYEAISDDEDEDGDNEDERISDDIWYNGNDSNDTQDAHHDRISDDGHEEGDNERGRTKEG
ncbi:MAG: hypothetical protein AB3N16_04980 [Flavobacteriaceae bacterium]